MARRRDLTSEIEDYCKKLSVTVPVGFHRHPPSRYAVVKTDRSGEKTLVAKTWFSVKDFVYYIENNLMEQEIELIDFKERSYLARKGSRLFMTQPLDEAN